MKIKEDSYMYEMIRTELTESWSSRAIRLRSLTADEAVAA